MTGKVRFQGIREGSEVVKRSRKSLTSRVVHALHELFCVQLFEPEFLQYPQDYLGRACTANSSSLFHRNVLSTTYPSSVTVQLASVAGRGQ